MSDVMLQYVATVQALAESRLARDDVFITTKIHPIHLGKQATLSAFANSLRDFHTDYIDLLLIHYAECWGTLCATKAEGTWKESWRAMEDLVRQGKVLAIGAPPFCTFCCCLGCPWICNARSVIFL
jgi:diketogulonate reductase-like aldo/keto reductase